MAPPPSRSSVRGPGSRVDTTGWSVSPPPVAGRVRLGEGQPTADAGLIESTHGASGHDGQAATPRFGVPVSSAEQTTRTQTPVSPGPLRGVGGPLLLVLSLVGLVGLAVGQATVGLTVSETERARLAYRRQREEYDEWITTGTVPSESLADPTVEVDSLEGIVDVAVDIDRRVIDDSDSTRLVVLGEEVNYVYTPPR